MHSPGEISQVANMFDSRIFEENSTTAEPNIEFHIHAFLSPNGQQSSGPTARQRLQEVGVGPDGVQSRPSVGP